MSDNKITLSDSEFSCVISQGRSELPEEADESKKVNEAKLFTVGRRAIKLSQFSGEQIPDSKTPSAMELSLIHISEPTDRG